MGTTTSGCGYTGVRVQLGAAVILSVVIKKCVHSRSKSNTMKKELLLEFKNLIMFCNMCTPSWVYKYQFSLISVIPKHHTRNKRHLWKQLRYLLWRRGLGQSRGCCTWEAVIIHLSRFNWSYCDTCIQLLLILINGGHYHDENYWGKKEDDESYEEGQIINV